MPSFMKQASKASLAAGSDSDMDSVNAAIAQAEQNIGNQLLAENEPDFGHTRSGSTEYSDLAEAVLPTLSTADTRARALHRLKRDLSFLNKKTSGKERFQNFMFNTFGSAAPGHQEHWIRTPGANSFFGVVIMINAAFIGVETDSNGPEADYKIDSGFWFGLETAFLVIFISELILRFRADRCRMFLDAWNLFDTAIVLLGVIDTWILMAVFPSSSDMQSDLQTLTLFRLGRLVRIARILRVLRLLRFIRELLLLVKGLLGALKALIWAFLLIMMVLYLAAVFATELIGHGDEADPQLHLWFGSVGSSILTLSQLMTLEGWPQIVRYTAIDSGKVWLLFFFLSFLCCTNFALLNVVTAVMVEKVFEFAQDEKMQEAKRAHKDRAHAIKKIEKLFVCVDKDASGSITTKELKEGVLHSEVTKQFQELGIAKHDIDTLFQCLDVDGNGELSIAEFIEGCLRMQGPASSKDLLRIQYDVHRTRKSLDIKKLTRHMTWSAMCLHKDFTNTKSMIDTRGGAKHRKGNRSKTTGPSAAVSSKASIASLPALPISKEGLLHSIPGMPRMEAPPTKAAQKLPRKPFGSAHGSTSGTARNRPKLSESQSGKKISRVRPPPLQLQNEADGSSPEASLASAKASSRGQGSPQPSGQRRASVGHSAMSASPPSTGRSGRRASDGRLAGGSSSPDFSSGPSPSCRRTSMRARTAPGRVWLRRCDSKHSDLASSASNETSGSSAAHVQLSKPPGSAAGSDTIDFSLPPEGCRLLEEVQADQQQMAHLLVTLGAEIKELRRLSKPGATLDGSWSLKEEELHVQLKVVVVGAQGLRNADTLPGQGVSDPYCICRLRGKPKSEWRTPVVNDNLDPVWNCAQIMPDFAVGDTLEFEIMDKDRFKQDDMLGWAAIACSGFYPHGFKGVLPLRPQKDAGVLPLRAEKDGRGREGEITLHIQVLEKDEQTKDAKQEDACEDGVQDREERRASGSGLLEKKGPLAEKVGRSSLGWLKRSWTGDLGGNSSQKEKGLLSRLTRGSTGAV